MQSSIVRYTVRPEAAAVNVELIERVYAELRETRPAGLHYATFALGDGVSFVHLSSRTAADSDHPLMQVAAFNAFRQGIDGRLATPVVTDELREIGSYAVWAR